MTTTTTMRIVTLTLEQGFFAATCEGISGTPATTRREALGQLCDAFGRAKRWLNLGDRDVRVVGPEPTVGMAATYSIGTDCYAWTVTKVLSPSRVELTRDRELRPGIYAPGEGGETMVASLRRDGRWRPSSRNGYRRSTGYLTFGERETRLDPSF